MKKFKHTISEEVEGLLALERLYSKEIKRARIRARKERLEYYSELARKRDEEWFPRRTLPYPVRKKLTTLREREMREDKRSRSYDGFKLSRESVMSQGVNIRVCGMRNKSLHELAWKF